MKRLAFACLLLVAVGVGLAQDSTDRLVVHEWGTFTSVAGSDGALLDWRPLATTDLPSFVYTLSESRRGDGLRARTGTECKSCGHVDCGCGDKCSPGATGACGCKSCMTAKMRMETPVLYFYPSREMDVAVKVSFPKGLITEWYPQARAVAPALHAKTEIKGVAGGSVDWGTVRVQPRAEAALPVEKGDNHYYAARETDSALVRVCTARSEQAKAKPEFEKFLFYRGVGNFDLPLTVDGGFVVRNTGREPLRHLFAVRVKGGRLVWDACALLAAGGTWSASPSRETSIEEPVVRALVACGLYEREALAMVRTWRPSWFEEDGARVFYVLPSAMTEELLPLTVSPTPAELVRVLVGRAELLTPEREAEVAAIVAELGGDSAEERDAASKKLARYGRFAEPLLKRAMETSADAEVRARCADLLKRIRKIE